jgi:carbon-monoxide dehydrogenase iron sulfur subunit
MHFLINQAVCTGCGLCALTCSMTKEKESNPALARIYIEKHMVEGEMIPHLCRNCSEPECIEACPVGALIRDEDTNVILLHSDECTECGACVDACRFTGIRLTPEGRPIKCDMCMGDPQCVKYCSSGALQFLGTEDKKASQETGGQA